MKKVRRRFLSAALVALTALPVMATSAIDAVAVNPPHGSIVSDDPANNTPNVMNGRVNALLVMGNRVFVGGTFTTVQNAGSGQNITRNRLFSFNANTGQIDAGFNPNVNNAVEALAPSPNGQNIYVGGRFTSVNGNNGMQRIAQLQISNGAIVAGWDPNPQHHVYDLVTRGTTLYAAGRFTSIGGAPRAGLAALNTANGTALNSLNIPFTGAPIDGIPLVWKIDVTGNGSTMVVTGNFDQAGRPASHADGHGQPGDEPGLAHLVAHGRVPVLRRGRSHVLRRGLPPLHPRRRHLARRFLRGDHHDRRQQPEPHMRHDHAVGARSHGPRSAADVEHLDGWRQPPQRDRHGRRDLRGRTSAVGQQPVQPDPVRPLPGTVPRWRAAPGLLGPRPAERTSLQLEPGQEPAWQGSAGHGRHAERLLLRQRHRPRGR